MMRRLLRGGHDRAVYSKQTPTSRSSPHRGIEDTLVARTGLGMVPAAHLWLIVPASSVDAILTELARMLDEDIVINGGNSYDRDDIRRSTTLSISNIHDIAVSASGVAGLNAVSAEQSPVNAPLCSALRRFSRRWRRQCDADPWT